MIPVQRKPPPAGFKIKVYDPGQKWLNDHGYPLHGPIPKDKNGKDEFDLFPYWRACLDDLHRRYRGVCAYVSIYIHRVTGARSADHFIAKSTRIEHAYRWRNLRLASAKINGRKGVFADILDPFQIQPETFFLDLVTGEIYPNPGRPRDLQDKARITIDRLGLDDAACRAARAEYFDDYCKRDISDRHLRRMCPFVWYEVHRQKMTV